MAIGQELLNVPMGDMIRQMALAIAEGQIKLDGSSIEVAEMMGGLKVVTNAAGDQAFDDSRIFFGYDMMTVAEAAAYLAADEAVSGGDELALQKLIDKQTEGMTPAQKSTALIRVPTRLSMLELGFTPTFYQFVDTIIEVKIAIKITSTSESGYAQRNTTTTKSNGFKMGWGFFGGRFGTDTSSQVSTSQVDATYASKYSYSAEGSSLLRTKLVPLPPPAILEDRIRRQMDEEVERRKRVLDAKLNPPSNT